LRFPAESEFAQPVQAGSYLATYWMNKGQEDEWGTWAGEQVWWLYNNGRGFNERTHAQTGLYDFVSAVYAPRNTVPIELALHHRYNGLGVVVVEPTEGTSRDAVVDWLEAKAAPGLMASGAAAIVSSWVLRGPRADQEGASSPMPLGAPGGSPDRVVQLTFVDTEPAGQWDAYREYGATIDAGGVGKVSFAAPFVPTIVGTDTYTDQLW
jgi:hypothetical protein